MTVLAHLYAQHDGTGTLTIGERTDTVAADDLTSGLEQLLALVVTEAKSLGQGVDVVAQLEGSPRTGLRVEPTGEITEDSRILARSLTRSTPTPPAPPATRARRSKRAIPAPTPDAGAPPASRARQPAAADRDTPRRAPRRTGLAASIAALTLLAGTALWSVLDRSEEPSAATQAPSATPTPTPTAAPSTAPTTKPAPAPEPPQLRIRGIGDQGAARFRLSTDQRLTVRLRLWPRGDEAAARSRSVRLRANNPAVVTLRGLQPATWRWVADVDHDSSLAPVRGEVTVTKVPVPARPTSTATPAPTTPPAPTPTTTATPAPTTPPQPTRQPTKGPTSGGGNGNGGPQGDQPIDPGDVGPDDPD